ncbi:unnamed protein product [Cylindrotheca closterium]|uniref:EamA domain-containing protein n=1 Tax=Cylindrotheca closterium TaxID=2856 RepID=A0AAD2JH75_9STRA|nr:unnamed protein product [Cylindrotheca closterium]
MTDPESQRLESQKQTHYSATLLFDDYAAETNNTFQSRSKGKTAVAICVGQLIALMAASINAASFTLEYGMKASGFPMFLMLPSYIILAMHLSIRPAITDGEVHKMPIIAIELRRPWWHYICLSVLDILPNYLTLISLNHTSLASTMILGSLSVPSTMAVCGLILGKRFRKVHYVGVALCLIGGLLTLWTDGNQQSGTGDVTDAPHPYFGDICATLAAILYGVADSVGEFWTKRVDRKEYLGMIGLHGAIFSFSAFLAAERHALFSLIGMGTFGLKAFGIVFWYTLSLVSFYVLVSLFLEFSDATLLTLSLQSSNLWAILFSIAAFHLVPPIPVCFAGILIAAGVTIYEILGNGNEVQPQAPSSPPSANLSLFDESTESVETE